MTCSAESSGGIRDRVIRTATQDIPAAVAKDARFKNARKNSDKENARVESDKATERAVLGMVQDNTQLFKLFADNPDFRRWLVDTAFRLAYEATGQRSTGGLPRHRGDEAARGGRAGVPGRTRSPITAFRALTA